MAITPMRTRERLAACICMVLWCGSAAAQNQADFDEYRTLSEKGKTLVDQQKFREALPYFEKALTLADRLFGENDRNTAAALQNLAFLQWDLGNYAQAEPLFQRKVKLTEIFFGADHPYVAKSLDQLASVECMMGQYTKAEPLFGRALKLLEAKLGADHPEVAITLNNLANLNKDLGQFAKAEVFYQRSLKIYEMRLGADHLDVADSLNNLANLYVDLGQFDKAVSLLQRSLKIREAKLGAEDPHVALALISLANAHFGQQRYKEAQPLLQRGLKIQEAKLGADHPAVSVTLSNLANVCAKLGQSKEAESLLQRSLKIREDRLGPNHPEIAVSLNNLAALYSDMDLPEKAEPLLQRCLKVREAALGPDHALLTKPLHNLALLYQKLGRYEEVVPLTDRICRIERRHVSRTLPMLSEKEQLSFLETTYEDNREFALTVALEGKVVGLTAISAGWVLNGKAIAHQTLAERALLSRDAQNSKAAPVVAALTTVRQQLTNLSLAGYDEQKQAERQKEFERLSARERELSRQLGQVAGRPVRDDPWVELAEVREAIPGDTVLIEIARFEVANFKAKATEKLSKGPHYVVWLIPAAGQGEVKLIDLGEAEKIDSAVAAVRDGFRAAQGSAKQKSVILEKGEAEAEKDLQPALAALAKLVLEPLAKQIDAKKSWIISPDGALWLTPWAALPLGDGSYAIEKHQIRYVISGRDLVTPPFTDTIKRDPSIIMADPDFDLGPKEAATLTAHLLGKQTPTDDTVAVSDFASTTRSASAIGRVGRLPGTAAEASAVKPKLQSFTSEKPWVYSGKNALEGVFKGFHSPKVVVMSTHGFFLENQEIKREPGADSSGKGPLLTRDGTRVENPLLRCGLLLAGCNERAQAIGKQDDGVLTGLEIVGCDLRGTELVVLSACETGLGQVRNGEGVAGLRQAFQLAGAQAVVASLWQVSDKDTALLMTDFFDGLANSKSKAEALREAQLTRMKAHRDREGGAHPFFWAAFTLTGQGK
jgi:CHAT domain-containing protein/Tfp pilus assembly protein PilF